MKKLALTFFALFLGAVVFAQPKLGWGPKFGLNVANITHSEGDSKASIHAGIFVEIPIDQTFSFQPELLYSRQGLQGSEQGISAYGRFNYLNVPLLVKIYMLKAVSLDLGPQVGFVLNAKAKAKESGVALEAKIPSSYYNTVDFSFPIGLTCNFGIGLTLSARYNIGISNVMKEKDFGKTQNSVFMLSAGWKF